MSWRPAARRNDSCSWTSGRIKDNTFTAEGSERLRTAVGEYHTVKYRSSRPDSDKSTVFWCAPELGYLPLKVELRDGKDLEVSMRITALER